MSLLDKQREKEYIKDAALIGAAYGTARVTSAACATCCVDLCC